jgi:hypothetical protein
MAGFVFLPRMLGLSRGAVILQRAQLPVLQDILGGLSAAATRLLIGFFIGRTFGPHCHWHHCRHG